MQKNVHVWRSVHCFADTKIILQTVFLVWFLDIRVILIPAHLHNKRRDVFNWLEKGKALVGKPRWKNCRVINSTLSRAGWEQFSLPERWKKLPLKNQYFPWDLSVKKKKKWETQRKQYKHSVLWARLTHQVVSPMMSCLWLEGCDISWTIEHLEQS